MSNIWPGLDPALEELAGTVLTEGERAALELFVSGHSYASIASIVGVSGAAARDRVKRASRKLIQEHERLANRGAAERSSPRNGKGN